MADGPRDDDHGQALAVATQLHRGGDSARALELLPDLVAARPDDIAVRLLLARCLASAGTPAVALAAADAAVACDPTSWEAHALLAQAAVAIEPERARVASETAVQLAPHEPGALLAASTVQAALAGTPPVGTALTTQPDPRPSGGLAALLGPRTSASSTELEEPRPRLEPRLPAALDPTRATAPPPLVAPPAPTTEPERGDAARDRRPSGGADPARGGDSGAGPAPETAGGHRIEPRLPASLGGDGPAATTSAALAAGGADDRVGGARLGLRVLGLLAWLLIGFRIGAQGIGGPIGIGIFLLCVAAVGALARRLTHR